MSKCHGIAKMTEFFDGKWNTRKMNERNSLIGQIWIISDVNVTPMSYQFQWKHKIGREIKNSIRYSTQRNSIECCKNIVQRNSQRQSNSCHNKWFVWLFVITYRVEMVVNRFGILLIRDTHDIVLDFLFFSCFCLNSSHTRYSDLFPNEYSQRILLLNFCRENENVWI